MYDVLLPEVIIRMLMEVHEIGYREVCAVLVYQYNFKND